MATPALDQAATLQRTRDTLGKIIKKPPLTDKLLSKPPFRYLHDIITEVNKATGFFHGLYSSTELDAKAIQDKDAKLAFLQKAIDVLSFVQGDVVRVKLSKILAGQEVERTNEFLQLLSIAILKKLDSTEAVQRVLRGEKPANKEKKKKGGKKGDGGSDREKREGGEERGEVRERDRPIDAKGRSQDRSKERREKEKERQKDGAKEAATHQEIAQSRNEKVSESGDVKEKKGDVNIGEVREGGSGEDEGLGSETRLDRPHSARGHRHRRVVETGEREVERETMDGDETTVQQQSQNSPPPTTNTQAQPPPMGLVASKRPGSARPAPPRVVQHTSTEDITSRISMEMSVAPPTVILDTAGDIDEEGEGIMIEEDEDKEYMVGNSAPLAPDNTNIIQPTHNEQQQPEGVLTKTIVATKERLEGGQEERGDDSSTITITPAQRKRDMEIVKKEMDKLREDIQLLCRYTNPMGRVMDYLQEDTDTMAQELEKWRTENDSHRDSLRREESITENELAPLKSQLEEIDLHIHEQRDKMSALKASIIRQDNSIRQILHSIIPHNK